MRLCLSVLGCLLGWILVTTMLTSYRQRQELTALTERGRTPKGHHPNSYCRMLQASLVNVTFSYEDCDTRKPDSMTQTVCPAAAAAEESSEQCKPKYRCRLGIGHHVVVEWHDNPFVAQCMAYDVLAELV